MNTATSPASTPFSGYQKAVVGMLAFLQFAVILDFMLMAPLGAISMKSLSITPAQFGTVVSAYAFAAGVSGLLTAGFADRFDRKKLLLILMAGHEASRGPLEGSAGTQRHRSPAPHRDRAALPAVVRIGTWRPAASC